MTGERVVVTGGRGYRSMRTVRTTLRGLYAPQHWRNLLLPTDTIADLHAVEALASRLADTGKGA